MIVIFVFVLVGSNGDFMLLYNIISCDYLGIGIYMVNYDIVFFVGLGVQVIVWGEGLIVGLNIFVENICQVFIIDINGNVKDLGFLFFVFGII